MISMKELDPKDEATSEQRANLEILMERINKIRACWGRPMKVTSGLRSMEDHLQIYRDKASKKKAPFEDGVFDESKVPMKSKHLFGQAVDIYDPSKELQQWCEANEDKLKEIGLWMEAFSATPNWCHFQIVPYGSYKESKSIWFNP